VAITALLATSLIVTVLTTKIRRSAEAAQASEREWREVFEHNPVMYFMIDPAGTVLSVNTTGAAQLGYAVDELVGQSVLKVFIEEDREFVQRNVGVCLDTRGRSHGWEVRKVRKDGSLLWVRENAKAVWRPGNQTIILVACEDITERKRTEEELRASEARFRAFVDFAADAFMLHSEDGTILDANRQACESLGYTREELIGSHPTSFDPDLKPRLEVLKDRLSAGEIFTFESRNRRNDGTLFSVEVRVRPFRDRGRRFAVSLARDITDRKRAEEKLHEARAELAQVSRVTTLGELTAAIAHEVSQPLTGIVSSGNACLRWLANDALDLDAARRAVERMIRDSSRAAEVVSRIRALVKKSPPRYDWLDINSAIGDVLSLVGTEVQRNRVSLRMKLADGLPLVFGDRIQLQQVILNLVKNASEAMEAVADRPPELSISSEKTTSNEVLVTVSDSGPGFDGANLENIFDAFYSTKPEGMGIGLAVSRSIIEAHGGKLWATPNEPHGAVFRFNLPAGEEKPRCSE
jgi:PAS domain S-box-containing protein